MSSKDTDKLDLRKLKPGELAYVEFYHVEGSGCGGMGGRLDYNVHSSTYLGVISRKVSDGDDKKLNLFAKDRFVSLNGSGGSYLFGIIEDGAFKIDNYYLKKTEIVEFSTKEDLSLKTQQNYYSNNRRGDDYSQATFLKMYIYTGDRNILYDRIISKSDPFSSKKIFDKLGLDMSSEFLKLLEEKSAADLVALFRALPNKSRDDLKSMLEAAKKNGVEGYVKEVDIVPGVRMNVEKFLEDVEAKLKEGEKSKSKSTSSR